MTHRFLLNVVCGIAVANFFAFCIIASVIGGDAIMGHAESGRYFLSWRGRLTEVSKSAFTFAMWHVISVFITTALAIWASLAFGYLQNSD